MGYLARVFWDRDRVGLGRLMRIYDLHGMGPLGIFRGFSRKICLPSG